MKNLTLIIGGLALALNLLFGFLLSSFEPFNIGFTSIVIALNTFLIWLIRIVPMKDGFVIGLGFFFIFLAVVEYILGLCSCSEMKDNWVIITTIVLVSIQVFALLICSSISKRL